MDSIKQAVSFEVDVPRRVSAGLSRVSKRPQCVSPRISHCFVRLCAFVSPTNLTPPVYFPYLSQPASPTKPAVQARLEGWKSPSPTKENIENRLASANEARSAHLTAPIEKNNRRFEKVQVNKSILGENEKMTLGQKKEEICNKLETAEKKVESMTKERVEKVAGHNIKVNGLIQKCHMYFFLSKCVWNEGLVWHRLPCVTLRCRTHCLFVHFPAVIAHCHCHY